jgi:hypothetical protein
VTTLAIFLFGVGAALAGFLAYQIKGVATELSMWPASLLSGILFFGGLFLASWAAAYSLGWAEASGVPWKLLIGPFGHWS